MSESVWNAPIFSAVFASISSTEVMGYFFVLCILSITMNATPYMMSAAATVM